MPKDHAVSYYRPGRAEFRDLERQYEQRAIEERTVENVTAQLTHQFFCGQTISQISKNPRGGMYGRVLKDEGGSHRVVVLTRRGKQVFCTREYIKLYDA